MKIAIDARAYSWTGIGRYIRSLTDELEKLTTSHTFILLMGEQGARQYQGSFEVVTVDDTYYSWREQLVLWRQLQSIEADLWHFTHFNVPLLFNQPYVVTIHDVTRFIFPGQKRQSLLQQVAYEYLFSRTVARAKAVITVSRATRFDLLDLPLALPPHLVTIYEGVDERFSIMPDQLQQTKIRMLLGTNNPYLLYVGVWMSHKNLERVLAAYKQLLIDHPDLRLVVTGKPVPGYANLLSVAERLGIRDRIVFPGFVPDELLPALYAQAACFIFPSLYEGFGLPLLEAALCGAPIVTSNVSSMPEVVGKGAIFVNPESADDIERGIRLVLSDPQLRERLRAAARMRAQEFSWQRSAEQHVQVYETAPIA